MRRLKTWLIILLALFGVIQFFQPARNESGQVLSSDIALQHFVPAEVQGILENSCYDCHSNNTRYPWYSKIQPGGWWMAGHIRKGKKELNFSEFGSYSQRRKISKLKSVVSSLEDNTMPLPSYLWLHHDARLSVEQKAAIASWAISLKDSLAAGQ